MAEPIFLGVNIDHIATLRQARRAPEPDPVQAAALAELGGADGITVHIRSDRRHINERDLELLAATVKTHLNVEMAATEEMLDVARRYGPDNVTLVPERAEEITTEGGLDVAGDPRRLDEHIRALKEAGMTVAIFLDPDRKQVEAAADLNVDQIEINTSSYAESSETRRAEPIEKQRQVVAEMAKLAAGAGLRVAAGHGLTYRNVGEIVAIPEIVELNIGHNIVARAALVGLERAVREMKALLTRR
ncbi:MAG: pyridoxine 5'-phosphate synthase [Acidobacteriota bacterium]